MTDQKITIQIFIKESIPSKPYLRSCLLTSFDLQCLLFLLLKTALTRALSSIKRYISLLQR